MRGSCQYISRLQVSGVDGAVGECGQDTLVILVWVEGQVDARCPSQEVKWAGQVVVIGIWGNVIMNGHLSSKGPCTNDVSTGGKGVAQILAIGREVV